MTKWTKCRDLYVARPRQAGIWVAFDTGNRKHSSLFRWIGGMCAFADEPDHHLIQGTVVYGSTLGHVKQSLDREIWKIRQSAKGFDKVARELGMSD